MNMTKIQLERNETSITVGELARRLSVDASTPPSSSDHSGFLRDVIYDLARADDRRKAGLHRIAGEFSEILGKPVDAMTVLTLEELAAWEIREKYITIEQDRPRPHRPPHYDKAYDRVCDAAGSERGNETTLHVSEPEDFALASNPQMAEVGDNSRLALTPNSKADIDDYIARRAREIFSAGEATTKGEIAAIIADELKSKGYRSDCKYLSAATVERAIATGITGGRRNNGRKSKGN